MNSNRSIKPPEYRIVGDRVVEYRDVVVHLFTVGDVEDPEVYAAHPIIQWQDTEQGQWVMDHAVEQPYYVREVDHASYGYRFAIVARLAGADLTFWKLKWGK
jgi:hypothetical protein